MESALLLYTALLVVAALVCLSFVVIGLLKRDMVGAIPMTLLCLSGTAYIVGTIFEIRSTTLRALELSLLVEYFGIVLIGPWWYLMTRSISRKNDRHIGMEFLFLAIVPVFVLFIVATDTRHLLFHVDLQLSRKGPFTIPVFGKGPVYLVNMIYMNSMVLAGTVIAFLNMIHAKMIFSKQAAITFIGSLVPWLGMLIYQLGLSPYGLDTGPLGFAIGCVVLALGTFRYGLFEISPAVYESVFSCMADGVLVFDRKGRMIGYNAAASVAESAVCPENIGKGNEEIVWRMPAIREMLDERRGDFESVELKSSSGVYRATVSVMHSKGRSVGKIIALNDITRTNQLLSEVAEEAQKAKKAEKAKEALLYSVFPKKVAEELEREGYSRPKSIDSATILFSDFVDFTRKTKGIEPISVVSYLSRYYGFFDTISALRNVERLKTMGDGYMCAGGIPDSNRTHPIDLCMMALEMLDYVRASEKDGLHMDIRIGINTGSVTAGIIGKGRFAYDIWGEAVNLASRHEASGLPGCINVSKSTYFLVKSLFDFEPRGEIEIKGGEMREMYILLGLKKEYGTMAEQGQEYRDIYEKVAKGELLLGFDI